MILKSPVGSPGLTSAKTFIGDATLPDTSKYSRPTAAGPYGMSVGRQFQVVHRVYPRDLQPGTSFVVIRVIIKEKVNPEPEIIAYPSIWLHKSTYL